MADEIIVLDSYSTDNTVAIARQKGAIVKQEQFSQDILQQKNKALQLATHNYVLSLDADEVLSEKLVTSILRQKIYFTHQVHIL